MRLIWTRRATLDLAEIRLYIARNNPVAASRVATRIGQAVARLVDHPNLGRSGREPGTRELVVTRTRYVVAYRIDQESVTVLAVIHGARQWPRL
jgi:addiction module RelE/StbE family toxin